MTFAILLFFVNVLWSIRNGKRSGPNPWGARTLEWQIPSPPNYYNFKHIPTVYGSAVRLLAAAAVQGARGRAHRFAAAGRGRSALMSVASLAQDAHGEADQLYIETRELRLQGFLLFLISDCVLFSSFIFAYLYMRNSGQGWPPPGIQRLDVRFRRVELGRALRIRRHDALRARELQARALDAVYVVLARDDRARRRVSSAVRPTSTRISSTAST